MPEAALTPRLGGVPDLAPADLLLGAGVDRIVAAQCQLERAVERHLPRAIAWNVHYPGPDGVFGPTDPTLIDTENNPVGLDRDDPAGKDDVTTLNQLHLPVNKPAVIQLSSKDVIHSFFILAMRVKQDAIPGPVWEPGPSRLRRSYDGRLGEVSLIVFRAVLAFTR